MNIRPGDMYAKDGYIELVVRDWRDGVLFTVIVGANTEGEYGKVYQSGNARRGLSLMAYLEAMPDKYIGNIDDVIRPILRRG